MSGEKDLADIEVTAPPVGWSADVDDDGAPDVVDVYDLDEGAGD